MPAAAYMLFYDRFPAVAVAGAASPVAGASPVAAALLPPLTPDLLSHGPSSPLLTPTVLEQRCKPYTGSLPCAVSLPCLPNVLAVASS